MISRHRPSVLLLAVCAAAMLGLVALDAHMKLAKSSPAAGATLTAPPADVRVWFTQAPDEKVSRLELRGPGGAVKLNGFHAMPDKSLMALVGDTMPDGAYTVAWQSAGDDGHVQKGSYTFTVKRVQ